MKWLKIDHSIYKIVSNKKIIIIIIIKEYQRNRYKNLSQEEKNKLVENRKAWFNRQTEEKQNVMRKKAREYAKNRYHNHIVVIS